MSSLWALAGSHGHPEEVATTHWPHGTPPNLIQLVLLANLPIFWNLLVNLLIFWNRFASRSITLFVIFFHAIISHDYRFFLEVPPFEEVQDSDSSPRREEVGRRTLRAYGGFLLSFFYRASFTLVNDRNLSG